jgi:hypothetical protein
MCTYRTENVSIAGSGKGPQGWFGVTDATSMGPAARVAVELTEESARALVTAITSTLAAGNGH